ncbi:MAG TPA: hypothetical protein PLO61_04010 [Fimbriimonadaceae bacterium]|nr:hypothetical protein [Fimbriimonadaceae bacterium]HRJ32873.1 hypothetical protein [Fimbriimonadaceae bacterium]
MLSLCAAWVLQQATSESTLPSLAFPARPIPVELERGRELARKGRALITVGAEDRVPVAKWFDGVLARDVEFIEYLSPGLISRWLGYLDAKELWPEGELQNRWSVLRGRLDGQATFVVTLSAFPKLSVQELTEEVPADPTPLEKSRFVLTVGERRIEARGSLMASWQAKSRDELLPYRWWIDSPLDPLLTPLEESDANEAPLPLGDYHQAWHWVQVPLVPEMHGPNGFQLSVVSSRSLRTASFPRARPRGTIE